MQKVNTLELSVNAQDACSLQGIRRQKSILHVSQSLLSQHLEKDSKQTSLLSPSCTVGAESYFALQISFDWGRQNTCCTY